MNRILVVEDETTLRDLLVRSLTFEGYEVIGAQDGDDALKKVAAKPPDLIISDIRMPLLNGMEMVAVLRANPATRLIPIIMLTAAVDRATHRQSMELGADDFVTKPFEMDELLGAITAQLRRRQWMQEEVGPEEAEGMIEFAHWRFDESRRLLIAVDGTERQLTISETRLLMALIECAGRPIDRQELQERMGRAVTSPTDRSIDVFINHLRQKIELDPRNPQLLKTVRSAGYLFDIDRQSIRRGPKLRDLADARAAVRVS